MEFIFNKVNNYILVIDKSGNIIYANDKILQKLGYDKENIYKLSSKDIISNTNKEVDTILQSKGQENIDLAMYSSYKKMMLVNSDIFLEKWKDDDAIFIVSKDISEKYYTKEYLEELLDKSPSMAWITNTNGKYIYVNKRYINGLKKTKEELLGSQCILQPNSHEINEKIKLETLKNKQSILFEYRHRDCKYDKWFEVFMSPIIGSNNNVMYVIGTAKDITARKNLEHEINNNNKHIRSLNDLLNKGSEETDLYELLKNICSEVKEHMAADRMSILLYDENRSCLLPYIKLGYGEEFYKNIEIISVTSEDLKKILNNTIEYEGFMSTKERHKKSKLKNKLDYAGAYYIKIDNELFGVINLSYKVNNVPKYNVDEFMRTVSSEIAIIIKNFRLNQNIKSEFEKRLAIEKELELFLETATDIMGIISEEGVIKKVTSRWTDLLGWTSEELLLSKYQELMHPEDVEDDKNKGDTYKKSKDVLQVKNRLMCKNGDYKWLELRMKYVEEQRAYFITAKDITEERKIESEKKILEEAVQLESIKNEFFANISHEFKTPLNIILGTNQLISKNIEQGKIYYNDDINLKKHMKSIKQNSYRLLRLINNLIDMTRIDTGYYKLNLGNYNIIAIIEDIVMSVAQYAEYKGINLIFDTEVEESIVACDPDKMERIILNILSNAIKYTHEKGEIKVNIKSGKDKISVSIKDSGVGIPNEKIDLIFERYGQAHDSLESRCEGSGIGLSLVKSLVEIHGGNISAYSEVGKGSEFIFDIPTIVVDDEEKMDINIKHSDFQVEKCNIEFSDIYSV